MKIKFYEEPRGQSGGSKAWYINSAHAPFNATFNLTPIYSLLITMNAN